MSALISPTGLVASILSEKKRIQLQIKHKIWTMDDHLKNGLTEKGYGHFFVSEEEMIANTYKKKPKK